MTRLMTQPNPSHASGASDSSASGACRTRQRPSHVRESFRSSESDDSESDDSESDDSQLDDSKVFAARTTQTARTGRVGRSSSQITGRAARPSGSDGPDGSGGGAAGVLLRGRLRRRAAQLVRGPRRAGPARAGPGIAISDCGGGRRGELRGVAEWRRRGELRGGGVGASQGGGRPFPLTTRMTRIRPGKGYRARLTRNLPGRLTRAGSPLKGWGLRRAEAEGRGMERWGGGGGRRRRREWGAGGLPAPPPQGTLSRPARPRRSCPDALEVARLWRLP